MPPLLPLAGQRVVKKSDDWTAMSAVRTVLTQAGATGVSRADLIRQTARKLDHALSSSRIAAELESDVRRAVKRGIAYNEQGTLRLVACSLVGYDRSFFKVHLLNCLTKAWCDKAELPMHFARSLGFARTGPTIPSVFESWVCALIRSEDIGRKLHMLRRSGW